MLRIIIVFGIIAVVVLMIAGYLFRHELETFAHKYTLRDDLKRLRHDLKRKEHKLKSLEDSVIDSLEKSVVQEEIDRIKTLIRETEKMKHE